MDRTTSQSGVWRTARAALVAEMRTRPDVGSGVILDSRDGRVRAIEYRPGNGKKYSVVLTDLSGMEGAGRVTGPDDPVLVWVKGFERTFRLGPGPVDHAVVQDGLRCSVTDAVVISELLGWLTGREAESVEDYVRRACA